MILIAYGTRPEIIKLFPVVSELRSRRIPFRTLFSGQQLDLYQDVRELIPEPDFSFAGSFAGKEKHNTLAGSFVKICRAAEDLFTAHPFDIVVVQGDTTTAWAIAQIAFYNGIRVAHVEAGLRTFDLKNPYPEELNRTLITQVAAYNFAPSDQARKNLKGCGARNVHVTGNTIVDAVRYFQNRISSRQIENTVLVTLHRRENHSTMDFLFNELQKTALSNPDLTFILPIHPNPAVSRHCYILTAENISVVEPLGYPEMLSLMARAKFFISDSGGVQEEASCLNKKILIVRDTTERPEIVEIGLGLLTGKDFRRHIEWARTEPPPATACPYGDGDAARKIVDILEREV